MHGNPNEITFLEKVNEVIDLCIDRELYQYLDDGKILMLSADANKYIADLQKSNGSKPFITSFVFPIIEVKIPDDLIISQLQGHTGPLLLKKNGDQNDLLSKWSNLFWTKRLRAEILKNNNKEKWNERYDELILFLETHMPTEAPGSCKQNKDLCITLLTFLMELSALDNMEASYGYAERGRRLLEKIHLSKGERKPYERWIWWNMAMASQHMGRNQEAVMDFNRVIKTFRDEVISIDALIENDNFILEFLLNIGPARMQRASIQLKLQLGYHALRTLSDSDFVECLEKLKDNKSKLFREAAEHLINKKELLKVEALLQLDEMKQAESLIVNLGTKIFPASPPDWKDARLPESKPVPGAIQIQFVEQIVYWYLENAKALPKRIIDLKQKIRKSSNTEEQISQINKDTDNIFQETQKLAHRLASVENIYWDWVNGNRFDERIYFSRWAQFLGICAEIYQLLNNISNNNVYHPSVKLDNISQAKEALIESLNKLYEKHRDRLPKPTSKQKGEREELNEFRSDDLPDFVTGLSEFYKEMSGIPHIPHNDYLEEDHSMLLEAVDEYEDKFRDTTMIACLKRCNERLIWLDQNIQSKNGCKLCLNDDTSIKDSFSGLLSCRTLSQNGNQGCNDRKKDWLTSSDYESIMEVTENHLLEHLQTSSVHEPKSLHFMGLQRWNSLTPAQGRSVGGGYLIYQTDQRGEIELGIAIDPGFDYVRNLFKMGFSLKDIDIVLISHAHPDHLWDFESMVHLAHELDEKTKVTHCFNVILTLGSYHRLEHIITKSELRKYINPLVIDIDKEIEDDFLKNAKFEFRMDKDAEHNSRGPRWRCDPTAINQLAKEASIEIHCTRAYHDDKSERSDSFGFKIKFNRSYNPIDGSNELRFGYTGDTKWVGDDLYNEGCPIHEKHRNSYCSKKPWENVALQYIDCNILLIHLGSLIDRKNIEKKLFAYYDTATKCESLIREKNHLYLMGIIRFLKSLHKVPSRSGQKPKLILMGEFGEELRGGIRIDLVRRLEGIVNDNWRIVPVDVGLDVLMSDKSNEYKKTDKNNCNYKFLCALCDNYCSMDYIKYFPFGQDEAIFHICRTCLKAFPEDVRKNKLKHLYEVGRELKRYPSSSD